MLILEFTSLLETIDPRVPRGYGGRFYGVYAALVTEITDPEGQGRVRVKLPWSPDNEGDLYNVWARMATLMAGGNRGSWFIPDVGDEVLVCFEAGDTRRPYVVGCLWNGRDEPPETMDGGGDNNKKTIRSRNGVVITIDDGNGRESLTLKTPGGREITMKDGDQQIVIKDNGGNSVKLSPDGVTVDAGANVTINASMATISAGMLKVDAAMSKFSGVVQADTVISNSVIGSSYTPGAGNIW
ncbi:MAG: type IV secretion protein Rhs [Chitinivibrionales bacterium]|nr:type IV secretion protein Rhs [Chitinivibrionales bacterium]MBD3355698.1 type IV secretion protein Rhs [Chitinivibrionales bacterium]